MRSAYSVSVFTDWRTAIGVWLKTRTDQPPPPDLLVGEGIRAGERPAPAARHGAPRTRHPRAGLRDHGTSGSRTSGSNSRRPTATSCRPSTWCRGTARSRRSSAVGQLADRIHPHLLITELRSMAADDLWLSPPTAATRSASTSPGNASPRAVLPLLPVIEDALAPYGARSHWGKLFDRPGAYERLPDFLALASRVDPTGRFRNAYLDRLELTAAREDQAAQHHAAPRRRRRRASPRNRSSGGSRPGRAPRRTPGSPRTARAQVCGTQLGPGLVDTIGRTITVPRWGRSGRSPW